MTTSANITEFNAFIAALAAHDWHYDFASDQKTWRRGRDSARALTIQANTNETYREAFNAYSNAALNNSAPLLERIETRERKIAALRNKALEDLLIAA